MAPDPLCSSLVYEKGRIGWQQYILPMHTSEEHCWSGGRLITLVWGPVEDVIGRLCSCQELFTPSSFSPNGTSESIKTIITAIPESKEIILGCQRKHGKVVWSYLVRNLLDVHLARQPIIASIFCVFLVWMLCWLQQSRIGPTLNQPLLEDADGAFWSLLAGCWWEAEIYVCVGWGADVINSHVFTPTIA